MNFGMANYRAQFNDFYVAWNVYQKKFQCMISVGGMVTTDTECVVRNT